MILFPENSDCTELDSGTASRELSDRGNLLLRPLSVLLPRAPSLPRGLFHSWLPIGQDPPPRVFAGGVPVQWTPAQGVSLSLQALGALPALQRLGTCS